MDIIVGKRRSGKTTKLIEKSAEKHLYILTATRQRAVQIDKMAKEMNLDIPFPVTFNEFRCSGHFRGSSIRRDGLLIDDVDDIIMTIFSGIPIQSVTITDRDNINFI